MMNEKELTFTADQAGIRIDSYLSQELPGLSRSYIQKIMKGGGCTVGGRPVKANYILHDGDEIYFRVPENREPEIFPENIPLDILYEDDELLVVNKPKGMVVHPAAGHYEHTLVNALLYHCQGHLSGINGVLRPGIVHRIDRDTTGALVVCKTDRAHRSLSQQLAVHSITRKYRAICHGSFDRMPDEKIFAGGNLRVTREADDRFRFEGNIGRHPSDRVKMAVVPADKGKTAITHMTVLERLNGYTYVECELETGRTHQIRVHLATAGHPLLGDEVYGPAHCPVRGTEGQTLHAMVLGFVHPVTGEYMEFSAPLPAYFSALLKKLQM